MRLGSRVAATILLVAATGGCATSWLPASAAREGEWDQGEVEAAAGFPILVKRGQGRAVVALERLPTLGGTEDRFHVRQGDHVRYRVVREEQKTLIADAVELLPALTTDPEHLGRVTDLGDDPGIGGVVPVDARPVALFLDGHLVGARSLPPGGAWRIEGRLGVPRTTPLLFYGADEFDSEPFEAARAAIKEGFSSVRVLQGGLRAWREDGRPTSVSARYLVGANGAGAVLLDVRSRAEVERGAIAGSVSIPVAELRPELLSGRPWWPRLVVVGRDGADPSAAEAIAMIRRWRGLDEIEKTQPIQVMEGGYEAWVAAGGVPAAGGALADPGQLGRFADPELVDVKEFRAAWEAGGGEQLLLDVRPGMRAGQVPPFARNIPVAELARRLDELSRDREIWIYCGSGRRAAVAREILVRNGFRARYVKDYAPRR